MKIKEIARHIEAIAPPALAESYDNVGLLVGDPNAEATGMLINLDVTEAVIEEAKAMGINLIVTHHPIWFTGRKRLNGEDYVSRIIMSAVKNDIALYACHTNLDNVHSGVNKVIADKIGLQQTRILKPKGNTLLKLVAYVPQRQKEEILDALFSAGAGRIGNYGEASFTTPGAGTFKPLDGSNPTIGEHGRRETVEETRIEMVFPFYLKGPVINALLSAHPYEEVAYQIIPTENKIKSIGSGMIGDLPEPLSKLEFLEMVKHAFDCGGIRYADAPGLDKIQKVALCGGSGSFLTREAMRAGADAFITGDITYHKFFDNEEKMLLMDIGHYESEQFTSQLLHNIFSEKFVTFAVHLSKVKTNPVKYFN